MLVDKNGLCSNRSQSGPLPLSLLLCHGAGGTVYCLGIEENKNYYIGIDQSYVYDFFFSPHGHKLLKNPHYFRQTYGYDKLAATLPVTVANVKELC